MKKLLCSAVLLLMAVPGALVHAQAYPSKPIRLLVGFPPGGTNDIVARIVAPKLGEYLGQQVVVDNRGGANTAIATELGARAVPDGYTLLFNAPGHATNPSLMKLPFDSVKDFAFISMIAEAQNLLVTHPSLPVRTVKELIAISRKHPGQINYGSSGTGSTVHLSAELFQYMTGVKWVHIPYKGGGPGVIALLAGEVSLYFGNVPTVIRQARDGKLRAIAVTGPKRTPAAPGLLSGTTCCPSASPIFCAATRPRISVVPPGGNGMIMRMGLAGHACASACGSVTSTAVIPKAAASNEHALRLERRRSDVFVMARP